MRPRVSKNEKNNIFKWPQMKSRFMKTDPLFLACVFFIKMKIGFYILASQAFQTGTKPVLSVMTAWENESFLNPA